MKKQTTSRLGVALAVSVLVVVAALGAVYCVSMQTSGQQKNDDLALANSAASRSADEQQITQKPKATTYLTIKEWGVKLPLTDDIKDLTYTNHGSWVALNTTKFVTLSGKKCSGGDVGYMGTIRRAKSLSSLYDNASIRTQNEALMVGEYYYLFTNPTQMYCQQEPTNQAQIDYFTQTIPLIEEATKSIDVR